MVEIVSSKDNDARLPVRYKREMKTSCRSSREIISIFWGKLATSVSTLIEAGLCLGNSRLTCGLRACSTNRCILVPTMNSLIIMGLYHGWNANLSHDEIEDLAWDINHLADRAFGEEAFYLFIFSGCGFNALL